MSRRCGRWCNARVVAVVCHHIVTRVDNGLTARRTTVSKRPLTPLACHREGPATSAVERAQVAAMMRFAGVDCLACDAAYQGASRRRPTTKLVLPKTPPVAVVVRRGVLKWRGSLVVCNAPKSSESIVA